MRKNLLLVAIASVTLVACKKVEGPGGTSAISGEVLTQNHSGAEAEITEIVFTTGSFVEHGEYFILNTPDENAYYYVWYDNPTWISEGDPMLSGRIGIPVTFNYSDSNIEIAQNTKTAIETATGGYFSLDLVNDVLTITNTGYGIVPDADKVSSPFEFNIANQGKNGVLEPEEPAIDEKVYIIYGDQTIYNDDIRTDVNGNFKFTGLTKGLYKVYVVSKDTLTGGSMEISAAVEITEKKTIVDAGTLRIVE